MVSVTDRTKTMIVRTLMSAALLCGVASAASAAGLHKCKDAAGNISYQDHACGTGKVSAEFTKAADTGSRNLSQAPNNRSQRPVSRR